MIPSSCNKQPAGDSSLRAAVCLQWKRTAHTGALYVRVVEEFLAALKGVT